MEVFPAHLDRKFVKIIKIITVFGFPILGPILGPIVGPIVGPILGNPLLPCQSVALRAFSTALRTPRVRCFFAHELAPSPKGPKIGPKIGEIGK